MKWIADVDNSAISSRAQIRLLNNTFIRLVFSFTAVPLSVFHLQSGFIGWGRTPGQPLSGSLFTCFAQG
jgi:hypothetical protein